MTDEPIIDLLAPGFYLQDARATYRWMREHDPVHFDERNGMWAIATYDGVRTASGNPALFSNAGGSRPNTGPLPWMIDLDAPDHLKRRKLVNRAFTPARVRDAGPRIRDLCDSLIDAVCERGTCDLRDDLASPLPLIVIGDMLGIPPADRDKVLAWSDALLASLTGTPEDLAVAAEAFGEWDAYARHLIGERRAHPADDLTTVLVHAEVDGDRLDDDELVFEVLLLLLGGDETTRNVACGGVEQLLIHPDERRRVRDKPALLDSTVEEMLRFTSPIKNMQRTVTEDTVLGGTQLRRDDRVLLLYESANFDAAQFDEPDRFDVGRAPNDHVAFGFGAHFCLGASLARLELRTFVERVFARLPDLTLVGDGPPPRGLTGITSMPAQFTPTQPSGQPRPLPREG